MEKQYHIKNTTIEKMFNDVADEYSRYQFIKLLEENKNGKGQALATAYASKIVLAQWNEMLEITKVPALAGVENVITNQ